MSDSNACAVCGAVHHCELFGLSFCEGCFERPADSTGAKIGVEHEETQEIEQISVSRYHHIKVRVELPQSAEVSVKFCHEGVGQKLIKVFKSEYQAGDAEFDDAIYIAGEHKASTEKLLALEGARAAILALVDADNEVRIEHGHINFEARDRGATDLDAYLRAALALSTHIRSIA